MFNRTSSSSVAAATEGSDPAIAGEPGQGVPEAPKGKGFL
jgi:hypothetical protein